MSEDRESYRDQQYSELTIPGREEELEEQFPEIFETPYDLSNWSGLWTSPDEVPMPPLKDPGKNQE